MKYLLLLLSLTGGLLSFNSYAVSCPVGIKIPSGTFKPVINGHLGSDTPFSINLNGCQYKPVDINYIAITEGPDKGGIYSTNGYISTGIEFESNVPSSVSQDNPDTKPDKPDTGSSGSGGGTTVTPSAPDTVPHNAGAYQLLDQFYSCSQQLSSIPSDSDSDAVYNAVASNCNAVLDKIRSLLVSGEMNSPSDDNHKFLTKNADGGLFSCKRALKSDYDSSYPSYLIPDVTGSRLVGKSYRDGHINISFGSDYSDGGYCNSVYKDYVNSHHKPVPDTSGDGNTGSGSVTHSSCPSGWVQDGNFCRQGSKFICLTGNYDIASDSCISSSGSGGSPDSSGGGTPDSCPSGSHHEPGTLAGSCTTDLNPGGGGGSGSGSTDSNDNGDVVAAINAFHADNNKNHQELMDDLNKKPAAPDYTGMEGEFSSMVGGAMSGITDSVKSAWDAGKAAFGEGLSGIDSMLPDIKTSFDLPPGFEAASTGRCIPVVLDFDIKLVGIPDYHFHAVGTQVCLLYDKYIRPVLNFCMVILSFFVIHRLLIRSAEFLTDGRH